ncbi:hypothetical protein FWD20_03530 [Candidatus Saccharibacteria bacterium]|nr:hypothetical protein [Candidatus Saccharibacteria bacterium]
MTSVGAINLAVNLGDSEKDIIDKWGSLALTYGMIGFVATSMFHVFRSIKASEETKQEK